MPIVDGSIRPRIVEIGRLRYGKLERNKDGTSYPVELNRFRFTSSDPVAVESMAQIYGGEMEPWEHLGRDFWQVEIDHPEVVVVVPGQQHQAIAQWYEKWRDGILKRRCDGVLLLAGDDAPRPQASHESCECICPRSRRGDAGYCGPITRFFFVIQGIDVVGVTRLEAGGFTAASELMGQIEWEHRQRPEAPFHAYLGLDRRYGHRESERTAQNPTGDVSYHTPVLRFRRDLPKFDHGDRSFDAHELSIPPLDRQATYDAERGRAPADVDHPVAGPTAGAERLPAHAGAIEAWHAEIDRRSSVAECNVILRGIRQEFEFNPEIRERLNLRVAERVRAISRRVDSMAGG